MNWLKEHIIELIDLAITIFGLALPHLGDIQIDAQPVFGFLAGHSALLWFIGIVLAVLGICRLVLRRWRKSGRLSKADRKRMDVEFQSMFAKCPYWIKVFLKTILDKGTAYSEADSFYIENYSQFLLQFIDYKTVSGNTWQYTMNDDAKGYFQTHPQLLEDVTDEEVHQHARRSDERVFAHMSTEFYWWYYSDDDYIEPIAWSDPANPLMPR